MPNFVTFYKKCPIYSLLHISAPKKVDRSLLKSLTIWNPPIPLMLQNSVALQQKMSEISIVKNSYSRKSRPKFTKIGEDLLRTNASRHAKFGLAKRCTSNALQKIFYTLQYFGTPGKPPGLKFTNRVRCTTRPAPLSTLQISSGSENPYIRYLLPTFLDFGNGVTEKKQQQMTPCGD